MKLLNELDFTVRTAVVLCQILIEKIVAQIPSAMGTYTFCLEILHYLLLPLYHGAGLTECLDEENHR